MFIPTFIHYSKFSRMLTTTTPCIWHSSMCFVVGWRVFTYARQPSVPWNVQILCESTQPSWKLAWMFCGKKRKSCKQTRLFVYLCPVSLQFTVRMYISYLIIQAPNNILQYNSLNSVVALDFNFKVFISLLTKRLKIIDPQIIFMNSSIFLKGLALTTYYVNNSFELKCTRCQNKW